MKKIEFDLNDIVGMYNLEIGSGGLGEAMFNASISFGVGDDIGQDSYGFDECYAKACTKFKEETHLTYVPSAYVDLLIEDTLQAMADSARNDYEDAVVRRIEKRIEKLAIVAVTGDRAAPCDVKRAYFTNNAGEKCSVWEAATVVAEVTEKEAHEFVRSHKEDTSCDTFVEWHEYYNIEDELKEDWSADVISWDYWEYYGDATCSFDDYLDSSAAYTALEDKKKHEQRLKAQIKHKAPIRARLPLFGGLLGKCVEGQPC